MPLTTINNSNPCNCRTRCNSRKHCSCKSSDVPCSNLCHAGHSCTNTLTIRMSKKHMVCDLTEFKESSDIQGISKTDWVTCCDVRLKTYHQRILLSKCAWLDDLIVTASQYLLKKQYPHIGSLQAPSLSEKLAMKPPGKEFVQILNVTGNYWITVSNFGCGSSRIEVFDSLGGLLSQQCLKVVADLMQCEESKIAIDYVDVQKQQGGNDCGLFAIAFATSICSRQSPATLSYDQSLMRSHLLQCLERKKMVKFPS